MNPLDIIQNEHLKVREHLEYELAGVRTGRATPSMIEQVPVKAYGSVMKLMELASISAPDPRTLSVQPWDITVLKDIEKALQEANTGCGIAVDSDVVRLTVPILTQETREQMMKVVQKAVEKSRISLRGLRDEARGKVQAQEKNKEISEDEKFRQFEQIDKKIKQFQEELEAIGEKKNKELAF